MSKLVTAPVLRIVDYSLAYASTGGVVRILDNIRLEIPRGEVLGLVGESGSAKSSLANAIMRDMPGRVASESGRILLSHTDLTASTESSMEAIRGKRIAMVLQNASTALNPTLSMGNHMIETISQHRDPSSTEGQDAVVTQAEALLAMVGLPDPGAMMDRYAHEISGGEKQRVVLAMAFACEPELILFDEPTSALDATTAATLLDLFAELQQRTGVAALFISHDLGVVSRIADRVAVIYGGRIVEEAATEALFSEPRHPYTQSLMASLPRPSDSRTGRQLDTSGNKPARRIGTAPACIYAESCPLHESSVCDVSQVVIDESGDHRVACVKAPHEAMIEVPVRRKLTGPPTGVPQVALSMSALSVTYGRQGWFASVFGQPSQVHAVIDTSLTLDKGETLALVGESGCGKSTLAKAMAGLVPFEGTLSLGEDVIEAIDHRYRSRVQIIFQNPDSSLNPRHSIKTILGRPLALYRSTLTAIERDTEVAALLERVQLPAHFADRFPHQLSGGEKQRVAIARALAADPEVIICDEVTSGLDASVQASITALLKAIQRQSNTALIFITHDLAILRHLADRIAVMYLGEVVEVMSIQDLDNPPYHPYTEALLSSSPSVDPQTRTRRVRLKGVLPKRTQRLTGCVFESRCPHRLGDQCNTTPPPRVRHGDTHEILCHIDGAQLSTHAPIWQAIELEKN